MLVTGALATDPRVREAGWQAYDDIASDEDSAPIVAADLREAMPAAFARLAASVDSARGVLIAVLGEGDAAMLDAASRGGATLALAEPFASGDLAAILRMAQHQLARLSRGDDRRALPAGDAPSSSDDVAAVIAVGFKAFDRINAAFGRAVGDVLLTAAERRVRATLRDAHATVSRGEGPELLIALPAAADPDDAARQAIAAIERPFMASDHLVTLEACAGIARDGDRATLVDQAQAALNTARDAKATIVHAGHDDDSHAALHRVLETDLRRAFDAGEIDIQFQPQVAITTGAIVGVEALARWQHPRFGRIGPEALFATAARSDYLIALSSHVQRLAATRAVAWPDALADLRVAINVTVEDIARDDFVEGFVAMLGDVGLARERVTVEITESSLIDDLGRASDQLAALRATGCRVAIDDFGTGYSSLAYLKALPLDYLKIDKRLSQDITGSARDRVVVRGVIDMARSLGLGVIAEGVETQEQLAQLAADGCNFYQGYLCAEPLDDADLIALVTWPALPALGTTAARR